MAKNITPKEKDFSQWYLDVIRAAELADYAPVRGCMVVRPTGYSIWEMIQKHYDEGFKELGHVNAYFPLLIPRSFLDKEAQHVEGFAPECAVVTYAGAEELEEPLVIRPTSETVIGHMYSKWVQSWRDLPILINQWCNVMRWEKRPRLFLRTSEFLWQEGHTAHATREEAFEETMAILKLYKDVMIEKLALPVLFGEKSEGERFPGADNTYTCEAMMSDKRAAQAGTSHFLGQNFAKAFDIKFQNQKGEMEYAWTTSWGVSTRLIGALIMTHGDNDGLVLPPEVAPVRVVILPISTSEERLNTELVPKAEEIAASLNKALGGRYAVVDKRFDMRPGDRFFRHLQRGVPLRLELGEKEFAAQTLRMVRRDTGEREDVAWDAIATRAPQTLEAIQKNLHDTALAFRKANTFEAKSFDELKNILDTTGGFVRAFFAGGKAEEKEIKEATQATVRCLPMEDEDLRGTCFYTGKPNGRMAVFGKAY